MAKTLFLVQKILKKSFFAQKTLLKHISTSIWSAQYPNAGQNIQKTRVKRPTFAGQLNAHCKVVT